MNQNPSGARRGARARFFFNWLFRNRWISGWLFAGMLAGGWWLPESGRSEETFQPAVASFTVSPTEAAPGGRIRCRFEFLNQGGAPGLSSETIFLHFIQPDAPDTIQWQFDHEPVVDTRYWMPGLSVPDGPWSISVPENTPEGTYGIRLGLWNPVTGQRGLDEILPVTLRITRDAPPPPEEPVSPLDPAESAARLQNLRHRFSSQSVVTLANKAMQLELHPGNGLFSAQIEGEGEIGQSAPDVTGFGFIQARKGEHRVRLSLQGLEVKSQNNRRCVLTKNYEGAPLLDLEFQLELNETALTISWKPQDPWTVETLEFDSLLWTTETLGGGAAIPRLIGQFFDASSSIEVWKSYKTYNGWDGLHIPMAGLSRRTRSALLSWDDPSYAVVFRSLLSESALTPGTKITSLGLHCPRPAGRFRIEWITGGSYVDIAQAYRDIAQKNGTWIPWSKKIQRNGEAAQLLGAAEFKPFVCVRQIRPMDGQITERVTNSYTADDCIALARHLHDDLQLEKVLFVLAGWIHRGYDNQHPDILPAAPEIGGNEGLQRVSETVRGYGYLFGLHDNYQDMYEDAPSWNPALLLKDPSGRGMKGGLWAGGQAWLIASNHGLQLAKRNLPEVKRLFSPTAYFIDTTFAAPLYESSDPENPLSREDDMKYKLELARYASRLFGVFGSETGMAFGVPVAHYFEGILSGAPLIPGFPESGAYEIPLFPLVYHDCVALFTHQGDRAGPGDARRILKHLVQGTMPLYDIGPHRYWETPAEEPDLTDPRFCFARGEGGWGAGKPVMDRFIKNTYSFLSPFAEAVATLPMTQHRFLMDDRSVEFSQFGQHWQVVVNYGPEDFRFGETLLPPMGFIALGPDFLAQHFYPNMEQERTALIVKHGSKTYIGFK